MKRIFYLRFLTISLPCLAIALRRSVQCARATSCLEVMSQVKIKCILKTNWTRFTQFPVLLNTDYYNSFSSYPHIILCYQADFTVDIPRYFQCWKKNHQPNSLSNPNSFFCQTVSGLIKMVFESGVFFSPQIPRKKIKNFLLPPYFFGQPTVLQPEKKPSPLFKSTVNLQKRYSFKRKIWIENKKNII